MTYKDAIIAITGSYYAEGKWPLITCVEQAHHVAGHLAGQGYIDGDWPGQSLEDTSDFKEDIIRWKQRNGVHTDLKEDFFLREGRWPK